MAEFPLRRAQLISPAGPGSLQTSTEGVIGIVAGIAAGDTSADVGLVSAMTMTKRT